MKEIKIGIISAVILGLILFIIYSQGDDIEPGSSTAGPPPKNPYIEVVTSKIDSIPWLPDEVLNPKVFDEISFIINDFHKQQKFDHKPIPNNQIKDNLSRNLYVKYTGLFIKQAHYKFNQSIWKQEDLSMIRTEVTKLKLSPFHQENSINDIELEKITKVLDKYAEVNIFIKSCKYFAVDANLLDDRFPKEQVLEKIKKANEYKNNKTSVSIYLNNADLRSQLSEVPKYLLNAHVNYLENKINVWKGKYKNYKTQRTWIDAIFKPISKEILDIDINAYPNSIRQTEKLRLKNLWDMEAITASQYFQ